MTINGKKFDLLNSSPKAWYRESVRRLYTPFSRADKWSRDLGLQHHPEWETIFKIPYKTSRETKLQAFSFKVLYRLIPCRHYLYTIRATDSSTCTQCGDEDTLLHFFIRCPNVKTFWDKLFRWCEEHVNILLTQLTEQELMFGILELTRHTRLKNWVLVNARFFIQKRILFHDADFSLMAFLMEIRAKLVMEKAACKLENRENKFGNLQPLFNALG